jgi:hypothetical protein
LKAAAESQSVNAVSIRITRPDLDQMVVGMALDVEGRPICCEMWQGNRADVKTLLPIVKRMRERFRWREITVWWLIVEWSVKGPWKPLRGAIRAWSTGGCWKGRKSEKMPD